MTEAKRKYNKEQYEKNKDHYRSLHKKWKKDNPDAHRRHSRINLMKRKLKRFGMTMEDWDNLYDFQGGKCWICGASIRRLTGGEGKIPATDHCHKTGRVRGLLCSMPCNRWLGFFRDDPDRFQACADYLRNPPSDQWRPGHEFLCR